MKKIQLSKETLRVLTAQESSEVAGGIGANTYNCYTKAAGGCQASVGCATATCNCPPPPATSNTCTAQAFNQCNPPSSACP